MGHLEQPVGLAHWPLGEGPAALGGGPALPQIPRGRGRAEESAPRGRRGGQALQGREGLFEREGEGGGVRSGVGRPPQSRLGKVP